jgi:hypothetical protein
MEGEKQIRKVLLLNPPTILKESWAEDVYSFPLGLAYIAAVLEKDGIEVEIVDCFVEGVSRRIKIDDRLIRVGMSDEEITEEIARRAPDLVGISVQFSCQLASALHVNSLIRRTGRDIITVAGGNHVSAAPGSIGQDAGPF